MTATKRIKQKSENKEHAQRVTASLSQLKHKLWL